MLSLVALASRIDMLTIDSVIVTGVETIDSEAIVELSSREISGTYAFIIPRNNVFAYPRRQISNLLIEQYPEIATATLIARSQVLEIAITERKPRYLWCHDNASHECFYMSDTGYLFRAAPYFSGSAAYIKWTGGVEGEARGMTVLADTLFRRAEEYLARIPQVLGHGITVFENVGDGDYRVGLADSSSVMLNIDDDAPRALENLTLAITAPEFIAKRQDPSLRLSNIDIRFGDKVYYTFIPRQ
ncbi:MAG: hypothetical protein HYS59_01420 [Candidatus Vogelbacteria bacterium]|nr:hypothetical protein [Candidatus Vogelbacteria bacterium]